MLRHGDVGACDDADGMDVGASARPETCLTTRAGAPSAERGRADVAIEDPPAAGTALPVRPQRSGGADVDNREVCPMLSISAHVTRVVAPISVMTTGRVDGTCAASARPLRGWR